jgi:hypothetical protein
MTGEDPIQNGKEPVIADTLSRAEGPMPEVRTHGTPIAPVAAPRPLGGRRISFVAWGLAGLAGIALWILIFEFI